MTTQIQGEYLGQPKPLFLLYVKTAALTLLTLGIYRFWGKTRLRKYVWSATSADSDSFEYTGTGLEKLLGFLVAVVILALYLGFVQVLLVFVGLSFSFEATDTVGQVQQIAVLSISFLAAVPLLFFAQYRARRYKLARTRWRGIRFGMENGAWGYSFRAMGYYLLAGLTLGILTPLATFRLEKYMTDRSWYGDAKFLQSGRWQDLFGGMKHVLIGLVIMIAAPLVAGWTGMFLLGLVGVVGYVWLLIGMLYYRIYAFNYMTNRKVLNGVVHFQSEASTGTVVQIAVIGGVVMAIVGSVILGVAAGVIATAGQTISSGGGMAALIASAVLYVIALLIIGGLNLVMVVQPIIEHLIGHIVVTGAEHLNSVRQRDSDEGADAEGFADALDVGGAL